MPVDAFDHEVFWRIPRCQCAFTNAREKSISLVYQKEAQDDADESSD